MSDEAQSVCALCGEPMPAGEVMFKYHGFSGPCPKPPLPKQRTLSPLEAELLEALADVLPYAQAAIGLPESSWPADSVIFKARAAIAKARGTT